MPQLSLEQQQMAQQQAMDQQQNTSPGFPANPDQPTMQQPGGQPQQAPLSPNVGEQQGIETQSLQD
jgi:hypothetical protein